MFTEACVIIPTLTFLYLGPCVKKSNMLMNQTDDKENIIDQALFLKKNEYSILCSLWDIEL